MGNAAVQAGQRATYQAYKRSGVAWLGDVPDHWDVRRLKYTASINDEALPETTDPDYEFAYADIGNVDADKGIMATETYRFEDAPSRARRIVREGDTIVSTVRTYLRAIAPIHNADGNLVVSTGFAVVRPWKLDPGYLSYALRAPFFVETVVSLSTGVSYPAINAPEVGNIYVTLPLPDEQKAIAAFLDRETARIASLIEKKQRQIELLQEKRAALISRAVTKGLDPDAPMKDSGIDWLGQIPAHWDVRRLKHTATINDEVLPETTDPDYELTYVDIGNVDASKGIVSTELYRFENAPSRARRIVRDGDTIVSTVRTYLRAIASIRGPADNLIVSTGFAVVRPRSFDPGYLSYSLRSPFFVETVVSRSTGVSYPAINASEVGNIFIVIPPPSEQKAVAAFLDRETARIEELIEKVDGSITLLREYRTALISAAVTGKINVRKEGL